MPLSVGDKLGPYEILALIGKGGMGEVYRAHDDRLHRDVAIKVSNAEFTERFTREARAIASLNHTNICHLYDVGPNYLVMEYIEGPDLGTVLRGPLDFDDALPIIQQLIDGIEAAHEKNIVHRDLKPANIKITPEGVVKILDFGLAKAMAAPPSSDGDPVNSPTLTIGATAAGTILGTAAYMAPEQAKGKAADRRSDIWSFGVILYEMLTGKRLFQGETAVEILGGVLNKEPDISAAPARVHKLLRWCLEKDRKQRLASISDARRLLNRDGDGADLAAATPPPQSRFGWAWSVAGLLLVALSGLAFVHFRETAPALPPGRFNITLPGNVLLYLELSPDGRTLSYTSDEGGQRRIWVRPLDSLEARQIPGTDGASFPFWSPNGENLGFFAQGKLKKIALAGGPAQALCDAPTGRGGSWNPDGVIVFAPDINGSLYRVSADGGTPTQLTKGGRTPEFIQGSKRFLFSEVVGGRTENAGISVGSLDGTAPVRILPDVSRAIYVPPPAGGRTGHLLFRREGTLMALPFDPEKLAASGSAVPLAENVPEFGTNGYGGFAASENGVLLYVSGNPVSNLTLTWLDRSGKRLEGKGEARRYASVALAPDGKRAAVSLTASAGAADVWLQDLERGVPTRFTFNGVVRYAIWSPDGNFIVFSDSRFPPDLYRKPTNGGTEELLSHGGNNASPTDISPDGKWLVYSQTDGKTKDDLWLLPLTGERKPVKYLDSPFNEIHGQFSPDGKWMAYSSDESGQNQVYVQPIPATGDKRQVSTNGGVRPRWRRDGKELFYISAESKLMAVPAKLGPSGFDFGAPLQLFDRTLPLAANFRDFGYQPTADGQKFLAILPEEGAASTALSVTIRINWQAGLKK